MKRTLCYIVYFFLLVMGLQAQNAPDFVLKTNETGAFELVVPTTNFSILADKNDFAGVNFALKNLLSDFESVSNTKPTLSNNLSANNIKLIIGTFGKSKYIDQLVKSAKIDKNDLHSKREKYIIQIVENPFEGTEKALVIAGSDMRGTIYGIYELSRQMGVSPWYYWADVPVVKSENLYIKNGKYTAGEPAVRYRGIFLNDEAPALSGWSKATFGGFNHLFYEKSI